MRQDTEWGEDRPGAAFFDLAEPRAPWHAEMYLVDEHVTITLPGGRPRRYRVVARRPRGERLEVDLRAAE